VIKTLRVDERLIHGQVVVSWCAALNLTNIVVANDAVAKDTMTTQVLKMAVPNHVKLAIKTVEDAIKLLQDPRCDPLSILVIVKNPADAITLLNAPIDIPYVNVGNFGSIATSDSSERKPRFAKFSATDGEMEQFKEIARLRPQSTLQQTAVTTPTLLSEVVK
jgi:PTS system mannose-specific IIB component